MKKEKGITLVSLVVTIIVLLILAGISINAVLGENGIITIARQAKENMELAQDDEQAELNELYMQIEAEGGASGEISYDEMKNLLELKKIIAEAITNNGVETSQTDSAETMAENIDKIRREETSEPEISLNDLNAGAYIKYNTGITSVGENGVIMCRVLYRASSEYGLQIIANENIGSNITLGGSDLSSRKTSYNAAITTINKQADKYLNTNYAVDARSVGSMPTIDEDGNFINKNSEKTTTVKVPGTSTDSGFRDADSNYTTDYETMQTLGILSTENEYWLPSRGYWLYNESDGREGIIFYLRYITSEGKLR